MKGIIIGVTIVGIALLTIAGISGAGIGKAPQRQYFTDGIVVEVNGNEVVFETGDGNVWAFYSEDPYTVEQEIIVLLDSRGTTTVRDDEVVFVK